MLYGIVRNMNSIIIYRDFIVPFAEEIKTGILVFVFPKLEIDERTMSCNELFCTSQDEAFEILNIHFDTRNFCARCEEVINAIEFLQRNFEFNSFIQFRDRTVYDVT